MELNDWSLDTFFSRLGSDAPAPGGGAAAGVSGALGAALTAMVSALTLGKDAYADAQELASESKRRADELTARFLDLAARDAAAYSTLSAALALPKDGDAAQKARAAAIRQALCDCTDVPIETMELAFDGLQLLFPLIGKSNRSAVSDLGIAAVQLRAAAQSAWFNVLVNIKSMEDKALSERYQARGEAILRRLRPVSDACCERVEILLL